MDQKIITNPMKVIRAKCLDCSYGSAYEVERCTATRRPLYPFRMGKNPYRAKRELTPEQKEALAARLSRTSPNTTAQATEAKTT